MTRNDLECLVRILWIRDIKESPAETSAGVFPVAGAASLSVVAAVSAL